MRSACNGLSAKVLQTMALGGLRARLFRSSARCARRRHDPDLVTAPGCTLDRQMTFAETIFLVAGGIGIYVLLRPLERWLEACLLRTFFRRHRSLRQPTIDVTDFTSYTSHKKEDHEHRS